MSDTNFIMRHRVSGARPTDPIATDTTTDTTTDTDFDRDEQAGAVRRCIERARGAFRRWPLPVRLLGVVGVFMLGWFLLMAPLFIAQ